MNICGSHKDRHQKIGEGELGIEAMKRIATHPLLADRPFILETPNDDAGYAKEIALIKSWG
jgi:deoxyribonuclease-4